MVKLCLGNLWQMNEGRNSVFFWFYWKQNTVGPQSQSPPTPNKNNQNKKNPKKTNPKIRNILCIKKNSCEYSVPLHVISNTYLYIHKHLKNRKQ